MSNRFYSKRREPSPLAGTLAIGAALVLLLFVALRLAHYFAYQGVPQ